MIDNLACDLPTFVTHLECSLTGERHDPDKLWNLSRAGMPLFVRYDLQALGAALHKDDLEKRAPDIWRYREFLPVRHTTNIVSLGEMMTPVVGMPRSAKAIAAATFVACRQAVADGRIRKDERILLFNSASGLKYPTQFTHIELDRHERIDYSALGRD